MTTLGYKTSMTQVDLIDPKIVGKQCRTVRSKPGEVINFTDPPDGWIEMATFQGMRLGVELEFFSDGTLR